MIGHRLYLLRKAAGLSQAELGDMLSVSHHTICSYEKDKSDPSDATKVWLARHFQTTVDYLVGLSDEPHPGKAAPFSPRSGRHRIARPTRLLQARLPTFFQAV